MYHFWESSKMLIFEKRGESRVMGNFINGIMSKSLTRRTFVMATAAGTAGLALAGCGGKTLTPVSGDKAATVNEAGEWITAACWHNCGGRCLNKALVVDGVVVRQKTDDTHADTPDYPQQRACVRGRAQRNQVFSADRIKYPMKRKHWEPGGGDKSLRGQDEWERISWDEALDIVASELKKAKDKYGNNSIFAEGAEIGRMLNLFGGYTSRWGTGSYGTWALTPLLTGYGRDSAGSINDRLDLCNCDTIIMIGMNPAWSSAGNPMYYLTRARDAGAKFICIDPYYNDSYSVLGAQWIPCLPGQDTALLLGVAHTLITEDDPATHPMIDWDFLNRCTIGFDADHMPEGEDPKGNFKDYVLGTYDGVPKTAEWASEICGTPAEYIRLIARELNPAKKVAFISGWAPARTQNADNYPQIVMTIGAMTGHIGKPGHMTGVSCHSGAANGGPALVKAGGAGVSKIDHVVSDCINDTQLWSSIISGKYNYTGTAPNGNSTDGPGEERSIDIRVIYHAGRALLQTRDAMTKGIEAHRKVDFAVAHAQFLTTSAQYCDLILPLDTLWERVGGFLTGNREILIMHSQVIEPMYECRSDQWIAMELAKRLGIDPAEVYHIDEKQQFFNQINGATVLDEDGKTWVPLVTITQADLSEWGVTGTPQQGKITLKEFEERGIYQVERKPGDNYGYIAWQDFVSDPEAHPLTNSESGKMEIYSRKLAETINAMGYSEIKPIPTHIPPAEGYEATFSDWNQKIKGDYPYQVINPHYLRRSHSVFDNVQWLRETWPNPVFINPKDAAAEGISEGNTVLLTSQHGKTLRTACLTERYKPGVIGLPHGAWPDIDEKTGIDKGGADNILCGPVSTGQGVSGWNTCIARLEKYSDEPLIPDVKKPMRIIS